MNKKYLLRVLLVFAPLLFLVAINVHHYQQEQDCLNDTYDTSAYVVSYSDAPSDLLDFEEDVDYMSLMITHAINQDTLSLQEAIEDRNVKVISMGLDEELITLDQFLSDFESFSGFSLDVNYLDLMVDACVSGDIDAGRVYAEKRKLKQGAFDDTSPIIDFDEMFLLSKIIYKEGGSSWLPFSWKMKVGEVLMNRIASPEFPDTLYECVYQQGQYSLLHTQYFENLLPKEDCVVAASILLSGERVINDPSVVFQASFRQGSGVYEVLHDDTLGDTYLCYSSRPELYAD